MNKTLKLYVHILIICTLSIFFELNSSTVTRAEAGDYIFYRQETPGGLIACSFNTKTESIYCYKQIKNPDKSFRIIKIYKKNMRQWFDTLKSTYEKQQKAEAIENL